MRSRNLSWGPRRSSGWPLWLTLGGAGLLAGWALIMVLALPKLTAVVPAAGADAVSPHAPLRLVFSRRMDPAAAVLAIEPPVTGSLRAEGVTLIYTPAQAWPEKTTFTVTLSAARSMEGLPWLDRQQWSFTTAGERIGFLKGGTPNVWLIELTDGAEARPLTTEPEGVYDYAFSGDGRQIVYAALRADGGADVRRLALEAGATPQTLAVCPEAACLSPVFSPDGTQVAYARQELITRAVGPPAFGPSQVHVVTIASGQDAPIPGTAADTRSPQWSPDGRLGVYDTERQALALYTLTTGAVSYIPNGTGEMGSWSADGEWLLFPEIVTPPVSGGFRGEDFADQFYSQLRRVQVATNQSVNLSGAGLVSDAGPVYSPSNAWIVFGRRQMAPALWTLGRQMWVMRADGSAAQALTNDPTYNHSAFVWSADETRLIYMRYNAGDPVAPVEIWVMNRDGTAARLLTTGYLPRWVP